MVTNSFWYEPFHGFMLSVGCRRFGAQRYFFVFFLADLISIHEGQTVCEVLGVFGCLRAVLPAINQSGMPESSNFSRYGAQKSRLGVNSYVKVRSQPSTEHSCV